MVEVEYGGCPMDYIRTGSTRFPLIRVDSFVIVIGWSVIVNHCL
jgi:hypothetical protein